MAVRELITKLSFQFDRTNLDRFEKSVTSFSRNITTTAGDVAGFVGKIVDYFVDIGKAPIELQDIAESAGIATKELLAMQRTAVKLGLSTENFQQVFVKINNILQLAKRGVGPFKELMEASGNAFSLPSAAKTDLQNFTTFLKEFSDVAKKLSDSETKFALQNFFGFDSATASQILRVLKAGEDASLAIYQNQLKTTGEVDAQAEKFREFATQAEILGSELKILIASLGWVVQLATAVARGTNALIEDVPKFHKQGGGGFTGFLKEIASAPFELIDYHFGKYVKEEERQARVNNQSNNNNIVNNIEVNVPPGTSLTEGQFLADTIQSIIEDTFQYKSREIMNNNPQVE